MQPNSLLLFETCRGGKTGCPNSCFPHKEVTEGLQALASDPRLNQELRDRISGPVLYHHVFRISLSGCPNSCSQPQVKDIGIQGQRVPKVERNECNGCGNCRETCPDKAIKIKDGTAFIDKASCLNCGLCIKACPSGAITAEKTGFRVVVGGKLGRKPQLARELCPIVGKEEIVPLVEALIGTFLEQAAAGEKFADLINRIGLENLHRGGKSCVS